MERIINKYRERLWEKIAPTYATLVMGFLKKQLYQRIEEKYGEASKTEFIKNFKRFFDDCFIFWQKSRAELEILFYMLNNINPKIQFIIEFSSEKLETDSHQYLNFFHAIQDMLSRIIIPIALARRICTIVTKDDIRNARLGELEIFLTNQNYPKKLSNNRIEKAKKLTTEELRNPKKKETTTTKLSHWSLPTASITHKS